MCAHDVQMNKFSSVKLVVIPYTHTHTRTHKLAVRCGIASSHTAVGLLWWKPVIARLAAYINVLDFNIYNGYNYGLSRIVVCRNRRFSYVAFSVAVYIPLVSRLHTHRHHNPCAVDASSSRCTQVVSSRLQNLSTNSYLIKWFGKQHYGKV